MVGVLLISQVQDIIIISLLEINAKKQKFLCFGALQNIIVFEIKLDTIMEIFAMFMLLHNFSPYGPLNA